jgi:glycosyltransferase involved in cell wall biosynthesis
MKKILIFHPALAPYRVDQFNALNQLYDLEVVFVFDNVWNHKFDQSKLLSLLEFKYSFLLKGLFYNGRVFRFGMLRKIREAKPDIILGFEYSLTTQYLILLKRLGFIHQRIGSTIDDSIDICHNIQSRGRYMARKRTVNNLDYLVVLSDEVSEYYQDTFKLKKQQIIVSPILQAPDRLRKNAGNLEAIAKEYQKEYQLEGKKVLLFVGRFIPEKALPRFISTISSLLHDHEDLVLVLVGDGQERDQIETFIRNNYLTDRILLPGRFEGEQLFAWYLCASCFTLPSLSETFGAVVNEALIFGLPVFCSKYAGASSLIQSHNGMIFDPLNEKSTNEKLKHFLGWTENFDKIDITNRPSLMLDYQEVFIKEWRKLVYA